jgi:predicted lysophospholipase L1 biosynthesis ABC-type transport system permease subunit
MAAPNRLRLGLAMRLALRELRGGLSGFYIFLACVALGTGAIAGVNSVSQMMTGSISSEGRTILGGDVRFESENQDIGDAERSYIEGLGEVSAGANMRTMARTPDGSDQSWSNCAQSMAPIRSMAGLRPPPKCPSMMCLPSVTVSLEQRWRRFCSTG